MILLSLVGLGVVLGVVFFSMGAITNDKGGAWVLDNRGVWVVQGTPGITPDNVRQQQFLIREAQLAYQVLQQSGEDLSSGPCLGVIFSDWVADIVHTPRQPIDDEKQNQCEQYLDGSANHFIELSLDGSVVRVQ